MFKEIENRYSIDWKLTCGKYVYKGTLFKENNNNFVNDLIEEDAEYIFNNYEYSEYASIDYIRERIVNDIALGIKEDGKLLGWVLIHDDGAIGMLHVLDEYRGRGFAKTLLKSIINKLMEVGRIPFLHIEEDNRPSKELCSSIGFQKNGMIQWVKVK